MKFLLLPILSAFFICTSFAPNENEINYPFNSGDLIFQSSNSAQSRAIQIATSSEYSHMGIVYNTPEGTYVYEAVQPVKLTPIADWIDRGDEDRFVVRRLKNAGNVLTYEALRKLKEEGEKHIGKNYDIYFEWSDDRMYCSELIWKMYRNALGVEIGKPRPLREFNLEDPLVLLTMKERYGDDIPYDEPMISPGAMFGSELLETVHSDE